MNKMTQEVINSVNILIEFNDNIPRLFKKFPELTQEIEILQSYVTYEVEKTLKDIIHTERL